MCWLNNNFCLMSIVYVSCGVIYAWGIIRLKKQSLIERHTCTNYWISKAVKLNLQKIVTLRLWRQAQQSCICRTRRSWVFHLHLCPPSWIPVARKKRHVCHKRPWEISQKSWSYELYNGSVGLLRKNDFETKADASITNDASKQWETT